MNFHHATCVFGLLLPLFIVQTSQSTINIDLERQYPTPISSSPLFPRVLVGLLSQKHTPATKTTFKNEYDYIVVGGGSAGSVVAGRLSEMPCVNVLLLEAGKRPPLLTEVPGFARFFVGTDVDWDYRTVPQKNTGAGLNNREVQWPSGKAIGGSSIINAMLFVRGNRKNYDDWAAQGATGWSYQDVLPYFKKLEENREPSFADPMYHGDSGPVTAERPKYDPEYKRALYQATAEMGFPVVNSNAAQQYGFFDFTSTVRDSRRCSAAKAYLVPADQRPNLDIISDAFVRKINIEEGRAVGVEVEYRGQRTIVRAKREVIVSAGAVKSAQLLMLSGVGPKQHLEDMNIPVKADLPVGQNFQDHCGTISPFTVSSLIAPFLVKMVNPLNIIRYLNDGSGPLASTEALSFMAFLTNSGNGSEDTLPDHQLYFLEGVPPVLRTQANIKREYYDSYFGPYDTRTTVWCVTQTLNHKSLGSITLRSSNPNEPPLIDPNYFANEQDLRDLVGGMKHCYDILASDALKSISARPFETPFPGCEEYRADFDSYLACQAKSILITLSHPAGTAKMGDPNDTTTVVDPQLRVKGISGLRVVDASVMPIVPSGNTNIPTIMVAEKASDMIKETIDCQPTE